MFFAGRQLGSVKKLLRQGDLNRACQVVRNGGFSHSRTGKRTIGKLIDQLVHRANQYSRSGNLDAAWRDLADASSVAVGENADRVTRETTRLVDQTVNAAQSMLLSGQPSQAKSAVGNLTHRRIPDRRANELVKVCDMINKAEQLESRGRMNEASRLLMQTKQLRPDLTFLEHRMNRLQAAGTELDNLTRKLRFAMNQSAWNGARQVSDQILKLAPQHQIARDAARRCHKKQSGQSRSGSIYWLDKSSVESNTDNAEHNQEATIKQPPRSQALPEQKHANLGIIYKEAAREKPAHVPIDCRRKGPKQGPNQGPTPMPNPSLSNDVPDLRSFMLWIDGVGGFLVCTGDAVTLGRAVPGSGVDIPVQADLRRHHVKINRVENQYLLHELNGKPAVGTSNDLFDPSVNQSDDYSVGELRMLKNQELVQLGGGVQFRFSQTHPLGRSAKLVFVTRHRTEPWSDAVLLMGDALLLGPDRSFHVCCPEWKNQVIVFRKGNQILLRQVLNQGQSADLVHVDGLAETGDIVLRDGIRIEGPDFSMTCERVNTSAQT